ncbi:hypothetical protein, partial [Escherichia coli]|uniref:hypothetical protein n=1 Tax=Escherichia coli TaxID=562 RepID=UPI001965DB5C
ADRNRSHWSTSKTPSYTKSVSWQHHPICVTDEDNEPVMVFNGERNVLADSLKPQPLILPVKGK